MHMSVDVTPSIYNKKGHLCKHMYLQENNILITGVHIFVKKHQRIYVTVLHFIFNNTLYSNLQNSYEYICVYVLSVISKSILE